MAGIYVHIPFCRSRCSYCDFFSVVSLTHRKALLHAMAVEIEQTAGMLHGETITTIYFGGGTPSLLSPTETGNLLSTIHQLHPVASDAEVTLEVNPDDVNVDQLNRWIDAGFNRFSIGIQSFHTEDLAYLDRRHNPDMAKHAMELVAKAAVTSYSVDLIYDIPGQSPQRFAENLAACAGVPHLSCYALTIEHGTPLQVQIRKGIKKAPTEKLFAKHWKVLTDFARQNNYIHYETSNLCLNGHYARHNVNYWNNTPYLGIGPSAHSYCQSKRWWNHAHIPKYIFGTTNVSAIQEVEELSEKDQINELIMTRLRTVWGINLKQFEESFGPKAVDKLVHDCRTHIHQDHFELTNEYLRLSNQGKMVEDNIIKTLFIS